MEERKRRESDLCSKDDSRRMPRMNTVKIIKELRILPSIMLFVLFYIRQHLSSIKNN